MSQILYSPGADLGETPIHGTFTTDVDPNQQWVFAYDGDGDATLSSPGGGGSTVQDSQTAAVLNRDSGGFFADFADNTAGVTLVGGHFGDSLVGGSGADYLYGDAGDDTLVAGAGGADTIDGQGGDSTILSYSNAAVGVTVDLTIQLQPQNTGVGSQLIVGIENLTGSAHDDRLRGDDQANTIFGGAGADREVGGRGDDALVSDGGGDTLSGGKGADTFTFTAFADKHAGFVTDLTAADVLDLTLAANSLGLDHFTEVAQFSGAAGEVVVSYAADKDRTTLAFDTDGDGHRDARLLLNGDHTDLSNIHGIDYAL